jgi:hypothetical protein
MAMTGNGFNNEITGLITYCLQRCCSRSTTTELPDDHRELEPPDSIPNSEVKRFIADGSVGFPHVRVGHRQAPNTTPVCSQTGVFFVRGLRNSMTIR